MPDTVLIGRHVRDERRPIEARDVHEHALDAFVGIGRVVVVKVPVESTTDFHVMVGVEVRDVHFLTCCKGKRRRAGVEGPAVLNVLSLHVHRPRAGHHRFSNLTVFIGQVQGHVAETVRGHQGHAEAGQVVLTEGFTEVEAHIGRFNGGQGHVGACTVFAHGQGLPEDLRGVLTFERTNHGDPIATWHVIREGTVLIHSNVAVILAVRGHEQHAVALWAEGGTVCIGDRTVHAPLVHQSDVDGLDRFRDANHDGRERGGRHQGVLTRILRGRILLGKLDGVRADGHVQRQRAVCSVHVGGHVEQRTVFRAWNEGERWGDRAAVGGVAVSSHVLEDVEGHGVTTGVEVQACGFQHKFWVANDHHVLVGRRVVQDVIHDADVVGSSGEVEDKAAVRVRDGLPHDTVGAGGRHLNGHPSRDGVVPEGAVVDVIECARNEFDRFEHDAQVIHALGDGHDRPVPVVDGGLGHRQRVRLVDRNTHREQAVVAGVRGEGQVTGAPCDHVDLGGGLGRSLLGLEPSIVPVIGPERRVHRTVQPGRSRVRQGRRDVVFLDVEQGKEQVLLVSVV